MAPPMSEKDDLRQTINFAQAVVMRCEASLERLYARDLEFDAPEQKAANQELHEAKATFLELQAAWVEKYGPVFD